MPENRIPRILPTHEAFYIASMLFNSEQATAAIAKVNEIIKVVFESSPENRIAAIPINGILNEVQTFIIHSASISRFLWHVRQNHHWPGNQIREALEIPDENELHSRDLRNSIEHFDEKLDRYLEGNRTGYVFPQYVGFSVASQEVPHHFLRAYYIEIAVFELLGQKYQIGPLSLAVSKLHKKLKCLSKSGGRLLQASN